MARPTKEVKPDNTIQAQIDEIKEVQIEILECIQEIEKETGKEFMKLGVYHGIEFK